MLFFSSWKSDDVNTAIYEEKNQQQTAIINAWTQSAKMMERYILMMRDIFYAAFRVVLKHKLPNYSSRLNIYGENKKSSLRKWL